MLIIGAGNCAMDLAAMLELEAGEKNHAFYDGISESLPEKFLEEYTLLRSEAEAKDYFKNKSKYFVIAVGRPSLRQKLQNKFESFGGTPASLISSHAMIGKHSRISDRGVIIMHSAVITTGVEIGEGCLINMSVTIGHGTKIGKFCEVSPGATFSNCTIGDRTHIAVGATMLPGLNIGNDVLVGAGSLVTKDVSDGQKVFGVPAKVS